MTSRRTTAPRRRGCLGPLVGLVWLLVAAIACYAFALRPYVSSYLGEQLAEGVLGPPPGVELPPEAAAALPTVVAALPPGEFSVSEQQANDYLRETNGQIEQVESVAVRFVPGQIEADVRATGTDNRVTLGLAVQGGRIAVTDPRIDGPLAALVAPEQLVAGLTARLNDELQAQGKPPSDVRIEQGRIVVVLGGV